MSKITVRDNIISVADTIEVNPSFNRVFVCVKYFNNGVEVTPSAGVINVTGRPNGAGGYGILDGSPIDCTDTSYYVSTDVPLDSISVTPSGIVGATDYEITITSKPE